MSSARFRVLRAALLAPVPLIVLLALARPPARPPALPPEPAAPAPEPARVADAHAETFAFFDHGHAAPATGRGLFATDYFKPPPPPPPPPPKPKPPAPPPKQAAVSYRGFAAFPSGAASVAYLSIDGRVVALAVGESVHEGWKLLGFDAEGADLARGETRLRVPFNQSVPLPAPAPAPAPQPTAKP